MKDNSRWQTTCTAEHRVWRFGGSQPKQPYAPELAPMVMKTMTKRFWIGMLAVLSFAVCVLAFSVASPSPRKDAGARAETPAATAPESQSEQVSSQTVQTESYEGIITDTHCGAKHSAAVGLGAADCTRTCVHSGEHFALVDGDTAYALKGDEAALKRAAGQRVQIGGTLTGHTISVASVSQPRARAE